MKLIHSNAYLNTSRPVGGDGDGGSLLQICSTRHNHCIAKRKTVATTGNDTTTATTQVLTYDCLFVCLETAKEMGDYSRPREIERNFRLGIALVDRKNVDPRAVLVLSWLPKVVLKYTG